LRWINAVFNSCRTKDLATPGMMVVDGKSIVYIVDDDEAVRHSICLILELGGFLIRPYASGAELLRDARPDATGCLVIDLNMPGLSGLEVVEQLRRERNMVPAIVMTGNANARALAAADRAGAALIEKPFRPGELVNCVERALGRHKT
jgi:FixJ family two-component response regulator